MLKILMLAAAANGFLAVACGAFGSHALKNKLDAYSLGVWQTANQYHFYHTLALLGVLLLMQRMPQVSSFNWSANFMLIGMIIFSGSLYALALSGVKILGAVTPIGGVCLLIAWLLLFVGIFKNL